MKPIHCVVPALLLAAACGGSTSASLSGNLLRDDGSAAAHVSVSLKGTSVSTKSDDSGHFELPEAPEGHATVHFSDGAAESEVEVEGLEHGHHREVDVRLHKDGTSEVEQEKDESTEQERNEVELRAKIDSIALPTLVVAGHTVTTTAATELDGGLKVGDFVEVRGTLAGDGTIAATRVRKEH